MITFPVNRKSDDGGTYVVDEASPILKRLVKVGVQPQTGNVSKVKES